MLKVKKPNNNTKEIMGQNRQKVPKGPWESRVHLPCSSLVDRFKEKKIHSRVLKDKPLLGGKKIYGTKSTF
jgi:hypothetical protein